MSVLFWLTKPQMRRIEPYFPLSHGVPRVDDRRIISGIIVMPWCLHCAKWQATPLRKAGGGPFRQASCAVAQRGWNGQPGGGAAGFGASPTTTTPAAPSRGTEASKACV